MPNMKNNAAAQKTRRKLIDAAGAVFAERGLYAATAREITTRAGVNVAAINYHFSDKFELYAAAIRYALSMTPIASSAQMSSGSPEERLRAYIADLIDDLYAPTRPPWRAPLLAHEFVRPTPALDAVIDELLRPRADFLYRIVRDILGPDVAEEKVALAAMSVGAQCSHYLYLGEIVRRLHPGLLCRDHSKELVEHITEFSLDALRAMRRQQQKLRPPLRKTRKAPARS